MITISEIKGNELLWGSILAIHKTKFGKHNFIHLYIIRRKIENIFIRVRSFIDLYCFIDVPLSIGRYKLPCCDAIKGIFVKKGWLCYEWSSHSIFLWSSWGKDRFQNICRSEEQHQVYKWLQSFHLSHFIRKFQFWSHSSHLFWKLMALLLLCTRLPFPYQLFQGSPIHKGKKSPSRWGSRWFLTQIHNPRAC